MRYRVRQISPTQWELSLDGRVLHTFTDSATLTGYTQAVALLASNARTLLAAMDGEGDGLLASGWASDQGIAFSERLAGGRDFTECAWSWRDPANATVPLMLQTETEIGHYGAELAGFATEISESSGTIAARGRLYDTEMGNQALTLLSNGLPFGVSVDPGEATDMEEDFTCSEWDDEGFCIAGESSMIFHAYEIIGITMTPFMGFPNAAIVLDSNPGQASAVVPLAASLEASPLNIPTRPPASWFTLPTPMLGHEWLPGVMGDEVLVDQGDGTLAVPLTITDDGLVFGHIGRAAGCHIGDPWGPGICASPPPSMSAYASFHVGHVLCAEGTDVPTGALTVGCEHAPEMLSPWQAIDFYANAGNGWADVHVVDDEWGSWCCGALRPTVTEIELRVLRALALSGDWRDIGGNLEMVGALAVNGPGLPIKRELLTASGWTIARPALRATSRNGRPRMLVAAGMVARCTDCQRRRASEGGTTTAAALRSDPRLDQVLAAVEKIERRTRHLVTAEAESLRARVHR